MITFKPVSFTTDSINKDTLKPLYNFVNSCIVQKRAFTSTGEVIMQMVDIDGISYVFTFSKI